MPGCQAVQENLTAWIDGELSPRRRAGVRRHLEGCAACAAEVRSLQSTIEVHRRTLAQAVVVDGLDPYPLWVRLQRARAAESDERTRNWNWVLRPVAVGGAALAMLTVVLVAAAGGPEAVLVPLGVQAPPPAVKRKPDLFKDYRIIQQLDFLEHFDTVESMPLDEEEQSVHG